MTEPTRLLELSRDEVAYFLDSLGNKEVDAGNADAWHPDDKLIGRPLIVKLGSIFCEEVEYECLSVTEAEVWVLRAKVQCSSLGPLTKQPIGVGLMLKLYPLLSEFDALVHWGLEGVPDADPDAGSFPDKSTHPLTSTLSHDSAGAADPPGQAVP